MYTFNNNLAVCYINSYMYAKLFHSPRYIIFRIWISKTAEYEKSWEQCNVQKGNKGLDLDLDLGFD